VFNGGFYCFGFWGLSRVLGFLRILLGSALWASWALPLYTPCVLRGALRFFNEVPITYQNKKDPRGRNWIGFWSMPVGSLNCLLLVHR
jgi:hypothetical protein